MKRLKLFIGLFVMFLTANVYGQIGVGLTGSAQLPLGSFGDAYKFGGGMKARIQYDLPEGSKIASNYGISIGYLKFQSKLDNSMSTNVIPITLFTEDYIGKGKFKGVWGAEIGGYNFKTEGSFMGYDISSSQMKFGAGTYLGMIATLNKTLSVTSNVEYNYIVDTDAPSWLGLNLGLIYKFGSSK